MVEANVNPTRTLSALLVQYGDQPDFADVIERLDAVEFFEKPASSQRLPSSLDGSDNYLPPLLSARLLLPADPFERFMPIYLAKMRDMLERAITEVPGEVMIDRTDQVFRATNGEIRLNWGAVEAPQVETYFERFHSRAVAAVRTAGMSILDGDPDAALRLYRDQPSFERQGDCYMVSLAATDRHRLNIYAKTDNRLRFEVKRHGRGRYDDVGTGNTPDDRLMGILFDVERSEASRLIDWLEVFRQFDEPDVSGVGDLIEFVSAIFRAANGNDRQARLLIERLIGDGGFSPNLDPEIDPSATTALARAGIITAIRLRSRHRANRHRRYSLTDEYASLRQTLLAALTKVDDRGSLE